MFESIWLQFASYSTVAGRIAPLPNRPSANRPPRKASPGQIGPIKNWHWTNRPPVENFCYQNLLVDLQRAFDWFDKDISSGLLKQKNKGSYSAENSCLN